MDDIPRIIQSDPGKMGSRAPLFGSPGLMSDSNEITESARATRDIQANDVAIAEEGSEADLSRSAMASCLEDAVQRNSSQQGSLRRALNLMDQIQEALVPMKMNIKNFESYEVISTGNRFVEGKTAIPREEDESTHVEPIPLEELDPKPYDSGSLDCQIYTFDAEDIQAFQTFECTKDVQLLETCISRARRKAQNRAETCPLAPLLLNNVGALVYTKYEYTQAKADLLEATQLNRKAMALSGSKRHAGSEYTLLILGQNTIYNFKNALREGSWNGLDISVQYAANFLNGHPAQYPFRPLVVNNYIHGLREKYRRTKEPSHLNEAITLARDLVESTSDEDPRKITMMSTLLLLLEEQITTDINKELKDLLQGIDLGRKVVGGTQDNHIDKASRLNSLGKLYHKMSLVMDSKDDASEAATCFHSALNYPNSRGIDRLQACLQLSFVSSDWGQLYDGFESAINLIPGLVTFSQEVKDKQHILSQVGTLASNGAAAALQMGKGPQVALTMLERGRGVLGASLEEIRVDLEELRAKHPDMANEFESLREYLDAPTKDNEIKRYGSHDVPYYSEMWPNQRHAKAEKFSRLIGQIQKLSGFERFCQTTLDEDALQKAASEGPIVVINVSQYRCDALVVERHQTTVIPLPLLTQGEVRQRSKFGDLGTLETLEWLWETVAEPILDTIGLPQQPPEEEGNWPHLWWVPTGPLVGFPIHAAGRHANLFKEKFDTVMDRVVSSYSYTVKAILRGRSKPIRPPPEGTKHQALLVGMERTSGCSHLPFATHEVTEVAALCQSMDLVVAQPPPKKQDVLSHLRKSTIFHFAGHGSTSPKDPLKSHILLQGGKKGRLRVSDLFSINIHQQAPFLAYLSACGTGRIGDDKYWDESIHLMSAFQIAGFRHVIGTLWEVRDETCVEMAKFVYEEMGGAGITDYSVSRGLHRAARHLRDRGRGHLRSFLTRNNDRRDRDVLSNDEGDGQDRLLTWVPYVHCGV